jgi:Fur family transcriptional regulator, ferric uptake regulator
MNQRIVDLLQSKKVKASTMRVLVYELLELQKSAVSLLELENQFFKADRITIYRTLKTFEKNGVVHSMQLNNVTKYILCEEFCNHEKHDDNHLHFYCTKCQETTCKPEVDFSKYMNFQEFEVQEIRLYAKGICKKCS